MLVICRRSCGSGYYKPFQRVSPRGVAYSMGFWGLQTILLGMVETSAFVLITKTVFHCTTFCSQYCYHYTAYCDDNYPSKKEKLGND